MKTQLLSGVAIGAIMTALAAPAGAQNADSDWTGFYVGLNVGAAFGRSSASTSTDCSLDQNNPGYFCSITQGADNAAAVTGNGSGTSTGSGFTGGIQAGYNWQISKVVFGVETDYGAFRLKGSRQASGLYPSMAAQNAGDLYTIGSSFSANWLATLRGRLGAVVMPNLLVYGTGGVALTRLATTLAFSDQNTIDPPASASGNSATHKAGWVIGAGLEWALTNNWSVKGEYLYVDFGKVTAAGIIGNSSGGYAQGISTSSDLSAQVARVGANYKF